jgi:hypothetical protein
MVAVVMFQPAELKSESEAALVAKVAGSLCGCSEHLLSSSSLCHDRTARSLSCHSHHHPMCVV